jgi:hypothetical protein
MLDSAQKRDAVIEFLQSALGLANELGRDATAFLIERALDEMHENEFVATHETKRKNLS